MSYSYDANKNLTAEDFNNAGVMDRYGVDLNQDAKDRMTSWTRDATTTSLDSQTWALSLEHNWTSTTTTDASTPETEARTFSPVHEIVTIDPDDDPMTANELTQTHDAKGNLSNDGQGRAFVHDFDNQLSQVTVSPGASRGTPGTHSYAYDALGRRVSKTTNSVTTVYVQTGAQVLAEYISGTAASDPERKYIYGVYIDEPIAMIDATGASEETYYYHRNHQYSIIGLSDDTGAVVERYAYDAYGDPTILAPDGTTVRTTSSYGNPYLHTGRRYDAESALYYYRARYYDALLGRFLERDPLGYPDGLNTYAAYHVMYWGVDPWGMAWYDFEVTIGGRKFVSPTHPRANLNPVDTVNAYNDAYVDLASEGVEVAQDAGAVAAEVLGDATEAVGDAAGEYAENFGEGIDGVIGHHYLDPYFPYDFLKRCNGMRVSPVY
jgi:RHS repeat-associated protein